MSYIFVIFTCICGIVVRVCESFSSYFHSYFLSIPACLIAWPKDLRFALIHNILTKLKLAFHSPEAERQHFEVSRRYVNHINISLAAIANLRKFIKYHRTSIPNPFPCKHFDVGYFKPVKISILPIIPRVNKLAISDITYLECKLIYLSRITPNNITTWPLVLIRHWFKIIQQDGGQIRFLQSSRICRINHFQKPTA